MLTLFYIVLALWVSAGLVQTYNHLKLLTPVAAEVLLKSWNYPNQPELAEKIKAMRAESDGFNKITRKQAYIAFVTLFYVLGIFIGGFGAIKHKFGVSPVWTQLMKDVHVHNPVNRF